MIRLQDVRLVNWYHFTDETFRVGGSCLLIGDNGSGKSTVLDAIQLALVADMSQVRFNKAANENSRRNLYGYVRYKLGSEDETRPGQVRFARPGCTSYVLLRFSGPRGEDDAFVAGVAMEASEADLNVSRWHFILPGFGAEDVPVLVDGDTVRTLREFRAALRGFPQAKLFHDPGTYREELRHRLGALPEDFHRLIVKALDFKPIGQIRDFILSYLLDERPVDTAALQANLENYKKLEAQAGDAEERIAALRRICEQGDRISAERRTMESHKYMFLRADVEIAGLRGMKAAADIEETQRRKADLEAESSRMDGQRHFLDKERDRLLGLLAGNPVAREIELLERDLEDAKREASDARAAESDARRILEGQSSVLETLLSQEARDIRRRRIEPSGGQPQRFGPGDVLLGASEEPAATTRLRQALERRGSLQGRDLAGWTRGLEAASDTVRLLHLRLEDELSGIKREGAVLQEERADLEKGRRRYPDGAAALLHLLGSRLKAGREPKPFCELIEVPNERWRDAVEGYLNTRRFDVIVAPEDFSRALGLYEKNKRAYALPGRGEVFISGVGLVDIEKIQQTDRRAEKRSLAEQVRTDDPLARAYADYVLGDAIACENEGELREHRTAVTDTVMVYKGHVARQTPPQVYRQHFIGEAARVRRMEEIDRRLAELSAMVVGLAGDIEWLGKTAAACSKARNEAALLQGCVEKALSLPDLEKRATILAKQLERMDRSGIEKLSLELGAVKTELASLEGKLRELHGEIGRQEEKLANFTAERKRFTEELIAAQAALDETFLEADRRRRADLEEHYGKERVSRPPEELREVFERQCRNIESRIANLVQEIVSLKTAYVNAHGFIGQTVGEEYAEFAAERELWSESKLPEYRTRIAKAKEEAIQQLAEDIIFRLRENLVDVRRQIEDLNQALKDVAFGSERYQFTLEVAPDHRDFYGLIMEAGAFEQDSIFGNAALTDSGARRTLDELFGRLIHAEARQVKTELEAKADYREYFDYDLKIQHADGTWSLYDKVAADKSGGETQNPYYVAIFASLFRLYRRLSPDGKPSCGLVLLDEAFSKMDEYRIAATLRFARELGLQLILATPKEKSELVAPSVETSLYLHRDALSGAPAVLDFTKEFTQAAPEAGGAAL